MIQKNLWRLVVAMALCAALATPARADTLQSDADKIIIGIVVVAAAIVIVAVVLIRHHAKNDKTITGCISSAGNGMTIADENDKQIYALSGNTEGITPGDRMKLKGKTLKSKGPDKLLVWETRSAVKDYGVCQP